MIRIVRIIKTHVDLPCHNADRQWVMTVMNVRSLDDTALMGALASLAAREREATVALILHLAEFDARKLYRGAGFSSLFRYCVAVLKLSEDAAANRIAAARMARRFPQVVEMLVDGRLSPTTMRLMAKHVTRENHRELIAMADGKTRRQVEEELASRFPAADVRPSIRPLGPPSSAHAPTVPAMTDGAAVLAFSASGPQAVAPVVTAPEAPALAAPAATPARPPDVPRHPAAARYEVRFMVGAETLDKLKMAQDLLSHAVPSGDLAQVFDRALGALVEDLLKKRFAITDAPKRAEAASNAREPAAVRRTVYVRDRGRCTYASPDGRRCDERRFLQFDHVRPRADGGAFTADNIRLRCGPHNRLESERFLGSAPSPPRWIVTRPGTGEVGVSGTGRTDG
jgi:hypothetical protein